MPKYRYAVVLAALLGCADANRPHGQDTCDFGSDPPIITGSACSRLQGHLVVPGGAAVPYGGVRAGFTYTRALDNTIASWQSDAHLTADGAFDLRTSVIDTFYPPGDSVVATLYALSPYWAATPFDSTRVTLHFVRSGSTLPRDTVRWVSARRP